jgi:hypothetical protein
MKRNPTLAMLVSIVVTVTATTISRAEDGNSAAIPRAFIDGAGPDWRALGEDDFVNVNLDDDTWTWDADGAHCTGKPVGVIRSVKPYTNFELVAEWQHHDHGGNSGIFVWGSKESLDALERNGLPHGDVFPTGPAKMTPFAPAAPDGKRSFPSKELVRPAGEWNHYYVRAIHGEVRLWVNGEEVSGGTGCEPRSGYLCLESEGAPVDFRNLRIRELP